MDSPDWYWVFATKEFQCVYYIFNKILFIYLRSVILKWNKRYRYISTNIQMSYIGKWNSVIKIAEMYTIYGYLFTIKILLDLYVKEIVLTLNFVGSQRTNISKLFPGIMGRLPIRSSFSHRFSIWYELFTNSAPSPKRTEEWKAILLFWYSDPNAKFISNL